MAEIFIANLPVASAVSADDLLLLVNAPAGTPETQKATVQSLMNLVLPVEFAHFWGYNTKVITGTNAFTHTVTTSQRFCVHVNQNPTAQNNECEFTAPLAAGDYKMQLLGTTGTNRGILAVTMNDSAIGSAFDWYAASAAFNVVQTITFTVTAGGLQVFRLKSTTKNASSTNYALNLTAIFISKS